MRVAAFVGDRHHQAGDVVELDEGRAAHLVRIAHAEHVVEIPPPPGKTKPEKKTAPKPGAERATTDN